MQCRCGQSMNLMLRTIVFSQKVKVHYVPVFSCLTCNRNEIHPSVKTQISATIKQTGSKPEKQTIYFQDMNEFAKLLFRASSAEYDDNSVDEILHMRVHELMDLLSIAEAINDGGWVDEIHDRLDQISEVSRSLHEWNV
jgi:hypothetical protein